MSEFITIRIRRSDREKMESLFPYKPADAIIGELIQGAKQSCPHTVQMPVGSTIVFYPDEQRQVEVHILRCAQCRALLVVPEELA